MLFYDWNVLLLFVCLLVTVVATALTVRRRPWDAAMVAIAPGVILCSLINWDLLAVALTAVSMLAWSRSRPGWAGVLLGPRGRGEVLPAAAARPAVPALPALGEDARVLGDRRPARPRAWLVVNVPVYLANPEGWKEFYTFSRDARRRLGLALVRAAGASATRIPAEQLNIVRRRRCSVLLCLGVAALILGRAAAAALRAGGVPRRRGVLPHQQGLLAAVRALADPARRDGPAALARLPHLADRRGRLLRRRSGTSCSSTATTTRACPRAGTPRRSCVHVAAHGVVRRPWSCATSCGPSTTRCAPTACPSTATTPAAASSTVRPIVPAGGASAETDELPDEPEPVGAHAAGP